MMRSSKTIVLLLLAVMLGVSGWALAADTATQTVTFEVQAINDITVSSDPGPLVVTSLSPVTDATTTYDITTNETGKKITGAIDLDMPPGTTLEVNLAAPAGATSAGSVPLTTTSADLVTGISNLSETGKTITYTFSATPAAGVIASTTRTVTFTITN